VSYRVDAAAAEIGLTLVDEPVDLGQRPAWYAQRITLEEPEASHGPIAGLGDLRHHDRHRYGTKAANVHVSVLPKVTDAVDGSTLPMR